jgi:hypothetical protein
VKPNADPEQTEERPTEMNLATIIDEEVRRLEIAE